MVGGVPGTAFILPKAEVCVRNHVQPYIPSILEALMVPTSQGFTEVRDVFFKEVTDMNLNVINEGGIDKLGEVRPGLGSGPHPLPPGHSLCDSGRTPPQIVLIEIGTEATRTKLSPVLVGASS
jgi:hypothetical protein